MSWREAFLRQAHSDYAMVLHLNEPSVSYCHRLHFLQMAAEKLGKALMVLDNIARHAQ
jgi:hypothetical protein